MTTKTKKPLRREQDELMRARGFLPVAEVAAQCGVTRAAVDIWMSKGHIRSTRVGLRVYIQRSSLEDFLGPDGATMLTPVAEAKTVSKGQ